MLLLLAEGRCLGPTRRPAGPFIALQSRSHWELVHCMMRSQQQLHGVCCSHGASSGLLYVDGSCCEVVVVVVVALAV